MRYTMPVLQLNDVHTSIKRKNLEFVSNKRLALLFYDHRGGIINMKNNKGETPLHKAAMAGHLDVVKFLLTNNADIEAKDDNDYQPIHDAAENRHFQYGTVCTCTQKYILDACLYRIIEVFVEARPDCVHWKGSNSYTALHYLCSEVDTIKMVKFLMDKEADVNAK